MYTVSHGKRKLLQSFVKIRFFFHAIATELEYSLLLSGTTRKNIVTYQLHERDAKAFYFFANAMVEFIFMRRVRFQSSAYIHFCYELSYMSISAFECVL